MSKKILLLFFLLFIHSVVFAQFWEAPLFTAIREHSLPKIKDLVSQGEDINQVDYAGCFPLECAIWYNCDIPTIEYLIKQGANINPVITSVNSSPPLLKAVGMNDVSFETIKLLLEYGADIKAVDRNDETVLMIAAKHTNDAEIADFLISSGADIHKRNKYGFTALHFAAEHQHGEMSKALIRAGADVNALSDGGDTPLMVSVNTFTPEPQAGVTNKVWC